jgi:hypothetical protein
MTNFVKDTVETTWAGWTEYTFRQKLCDVIYPHIISSSCDKKTYKQNKTVDQETRLVNTATREINITELQNAFGAIPIESRNLMDITNLIIDISSYTVNSTSSFGSNIGKSSFSYVTDYENIGSVTIKFGGYSYGEFGELLSDEHEINTIHGVIHHEHKYYAITNAFMAWLQEHNKPKCHAFLNELFYA